MKMLKTMMLVILIFSAAFLLVQPVEGLHRGGFHGGHFGGHHRGFGHHGGFGHIRGRVFFGGFGYGWSGYPYWWGYPYGWGYPYYSYYYPYYPYYWDYESPPAAPQEVAPPAESGQQQRSTYWRFCQDPEGYYPYVKSCPGGWLKVVPPRPNAPPPATFGAPILPPSSLGQKPGGS